MFEDKPWLHLIIQYSIHVLIENPGYTLADLPLFYASATFRDHLVNNVKYHHDAGYFWRDFSGKGKRDQDIQIEAAKTRALTLLGQEHVKHIIGQKAGTVDFNEIIDKKQIFLCRLSPNLSSDTQRMIGTIVVSELLHAVRRRAELPQETRHRFCIYVDEIQKFAS